MRFRDTPATAAIAIVTIAVSGFILLMGWGNIAAVVGGFIPARLPDKLIAGYDGFLVPAYLTPLSATLLHGGVVHLLFNMVMLVYAGRETERALGSSNLVILYLVGAFAAAGGQWAQDPHSVMPMIGASGAESAVVAAYAMLYARDGRAKAIGPIPAWLVHAVWLGVAWILINVAMGFVTLMGQPIAIGAHIGGFIAGLILARPMLLWRYRKA